MRAEHTIGRMEIAAAIREAVPMSQDVANELVGSILRHMRQTLSQGKDIAIKRFGRFRILEKGPRVARNPKNGVEVVIPPRRVLTFRASKEVRRLVAEGLA